MFKLGFKPIPDDGFFDRFLLVMPSILGGIVTLIGKGFV